jgi:hypothetical protein
MVTSLGSLGRWVLAYRSSDAWLWFAVGRWFDLRLGILKTEPTKILSDTKHFLFGLCVVVLLALDGLFLYALT